MPDEADEIGLQELIYQIKRELLAPNPSARAEDPYPLLKIERIELEIEVSVRKVRGAGVSISVLNAAQLSASRSSEQSRGHVVRVSLSPLATSEVLSPEDLRDPRIQQFIEERNRRALLKGQQPEGPRE